ncbi:MAG: hypothetical protein M3N98_14770, partial [Actinomycetota bacterium]|nr:hypothetical protein [Actinomycetota bacterium]
PVPAPHNGRRPAPPPPEDYPFPIEDYEDLEADEILPLLLELDDQELVEVLLYEHAGLKRVEILDYIDLLLEGEE